MEELTESQDGGRYYRRRKMGGTNCTTNHGEKMGGTNCTMNHGKKMGGTNCTMNHGKKMGGTTKHGDKMGGTSCTMKRGGKKSLHSSAKHSYRKRVAKSKCRGIHTAKCRSNKSCKMALGKKRSFCRKNSNTKRRPLSSK